MTETSKQDETMEKTSARLYRSDLDKAKQLLGLSDDAKAIRACINFTNNVAHNMFGGNIQNMFKRRKDNEEVELYHQDI